MPLPRSLTMRALTAAGTALCAAAAITPAAGARATTYKGKTREGDPISFSLNGGRVGKLRAYVPTLCLPTSGQPLNGTDPFDPPGSFALGRTGKVKAKRPNAIWNTSDVTKNFEVTVRRQRSGVITGKLHVDYSFLMILPTYPITARPYVCTGDTTFHVR